MRVGLNGLTDEEEQTFGAYADWLNNIGNVVHNDSLLQAWREDPAGDNYHYYRGSDFDAAKTSILDRYKRVNNPQGNSPASDNQTEGYDTYKVVQDLLAKSKEENGSLICAEILGLKGYEKANSSYVASARTAEYYKTRPCAAKVESAARIFANYLKNK